MPGVAIVGRDAGFSNKFVVCGGGWGSVLRLVGAQDLFIGLS